MELPQQVRSQMEFGNERPLLLTNKYLTLKWAFGRRIPVKNMKTQHADHSFFLAIGELSENGGAEKGLQANRVFGVGQMQVTCIERVDSVVLFVQ